MDQEEAKPTGDDLSETIRQATGALHTAALQRSYNPDLEASVLGSCLASVRAYEAIRDLLTAEMFHDPINALVWELYGERYEKNEIADAVTLRGPLAGRLMLPGRKVRTITETPEWTDAGKHLGNLLASMVAILTAEPYARQLRDLWVRRQAAKQAIDLWHAAMSSAELSAPLADTADTLDQLRAGPKRVSGPVLMRDAMQMALERTQTAKEQGGLSGTRTGFDRLDRMFRGMQPGRLYYLAGRPGMGKSALAQSFIRHGSAGDDGALIFALEMDEAMMGEREIAMAGAGGVDFEQMAFGTADQAQWDDAMAAVNESAGRRVWIDSRPRLTPAEILMTARRHMRRHPFKLLVVDHGHLVRPPKEVVRAGRTEQIEAISAAFQEIVKELGVAGLILWQLSRAVDQREDKRPELSDLRQSGSLEQDADAVMFVYRPGYYVAAERPPPIPADAPVDDPRYAAKAKWQSRMEQTKDVAEIIVAKNRGGKTGTIGATWDAERTLFSPFASQQEG